MDIKQIMKEKGITQDDIARELGITQPAVSQILKGRCKYETADKVAKIIGVNALDIMHQNTEFTKQVQDMALEGLRRSAENKQLTHVFICPCCGEKIEITLKHVPIIEKD